MTTPTRTAPLAVAAIIVAVLVSVSALLSVESPALAFPTPTGTESPSASPGEDSDPAQPAPDDDDRDDDDESGGPEEGAAGPTATTIAVPDTECASKRPGARFTVAVSNLPENATVHMTANGETFGVGTSCEGPDNTRLLTFGTTLLDVAEGTQFSSGDLATPTNRPTALPQSMLLSGPARSAQSQADAQTITFTMVDGGTMNYPSPEDLRPEPSLPVETPESPTPTRPVPSDPETSPPPSQPDEDERPDRTRPSPRAPGPERPSREAPEDDNRGPANGDGSKPSERPGPGKDRAFSPDGPPKPQYDYSDPVPQPPGDSDDSPDQITGPLDPTAAPEAGDDDNADPAATSGLSPMIAVPLMALIVVAGLFLLVLALRRRKKGAHEA